MHRDLGATLLALGLLAWPSTQLARAQVGAFAGAGAQARADVADVPLLVEGAQGRATVAGGLRYGYTEDVRATGDDHHRVGLGLAGQFELLSWLGLGALIDARYDAHVGGLDDGESGMLGQSQLHARAFHAVHARVLLGGELALRFPPAESLGAGAASMGAEARAIATCALAPRALLSGALGYRLDRSDRALPDIERLTPSDRVALGASESDAVLLGLGSALDLGPAVLLLAFGWNVLVGAAAPSAVQSPMRVSIGARRTLWPALFVELLLTVATSARPDSTSTEFVPVEPRFVLGASLAHRFGGASGERVAAPKLGTASTPPAAATRAKLSGRVVDVDGAVVPQARVVIASLGRELVCDEGGRFELAGVPLGTLEVHVQVPRWQPVTHRVEVTAAGAHAEVVLTERLPAGQIRGTVRGALAVPLAAEVTVQPGGLALRTGEDGSFVADVAPGAYRIRIAAAGYETQEREVEVEHDGVTVLLVDLRSTE